MATQRAMLQTMPQAADDAADDAADGVVSAGSWRDWGNPRTAKEDYVFESLFCVDKSVINKSIKEALSSVDPRA